MLFRSTEQFYNYQFMVPMRANPSFSWTGNLNGWSFSNGSWPITSAIVRVNINPYQYNLDLNSSGASFSTGVVVYLTVQTGGYTAKINFSAEL